MRAITGATQRLGSARVVCSKCGTAMVAGFVAEYLSGGRAQLDYWIEGPPTQDLRGRLDVTDQRKIPIKTYRCSRCGYLESYAHDDRDT